MTYDFLLDFNTAVQVQPTERKLIPAGTLAKVTLSIKPGGHGPDGWLTQSAKTGTVYLNAVFTVAEGDDAGRKIFQCIGVPVAENSDKDKWGQIGHALLRALWESAHRIHPSDQSDKAIQARKMPHITALNGLTCVVEVDEVDDKNALYPRKNIVKKAITIDHKNYAEIMGPVPIQTYGSGAMSTWQPSRGA